VGLTAPYHYRDDPAVPAFPDDRPIIVFDGHCVMCSGWVRFILRQDRRQVFRFLPAQTPLGRALYRHLGLNDEEFETNILLENGVAYLKAEGSIRMATRLGMPWSAASVLRVLPRRWQDAMYEWVARNRFRLFGRRDMCYRPEPGQAERFLQ
jgi:predicted DCC family thiol-disulfide oxidoreductase YuxK